MAITNRRGSDSKILVLGDVSFDWSLLSSRKSEDVRRHVGQDSRTRQWRDAHEKAESGGGAWMLARYVDAALAGVRGRSYTYDMRDPTLCPGENAPLVLWDIDDYPQTEGSDKNVYRVASQRGRFYDSIKWRQQRQKLQVTRYFDGAADASCWKEWRFLAFSDLNMGYRYQGVRELERAFQERERIPKAGFEPIIFAMMTDSATNEQEGTFWDTLADNPEYADRTLALVSANVLRQNPPEDRATISRRLSWELTAEHLVSEFESGLRSGNPKHRLLAKFRHLVIRFHITGAIHRYRLGGESDTRACYRLFYDPTYADGTFRVRADDGTMPGSLIVFASSVMQSLLTPGEHTQREYSEEPHNAEQARVCNAIAGGIENAIIRCRRQFWYGYGTDPMQFRVVINDRLPQLVFLDRKKASHELINRVRGTEPQGKELQAIGDIRERFRSPNPAEIRDLVMGELVGVLHTSNQFQREARDIPLIVPSLADLVTSELQRESVVLSPRTMGETWKKLQAELVSQCNVWQKREVWADTKSRISDIIETARINRHDDEVKRRLLDSGCLDEQRDPAIMDIEIPADIQANWRLDENQTGRWSILNKYVERTEDYRRQTLGIVRYGLDRIVNSPNPKPEGINRLEVPLTRLGKLRAIQRNEIESFNSLRNLLHQYVSKKDAKPLSFAVFGEPGSGKSFGIQQVAKSVGTSANKEIEPMEVNVAQWQNSNELAMALADANDYVLAGKTPMVMFDEFDCSNQDGELGWLKYFLDPMESGKYRDATHTIRQVARAVFVFIGGTSRTYEEFRTMADTPQRRPRKATDFVSRLKGHINILNLNESPNGRGTSTVRIRRAILLRTVLESSDMISPTSNEAKIDDPVIEALLDVQMYSHGSRSLRALIEMCTREHGRITKASLPLYDQAKMHVSEADAQMIENVRVS